MEKKAERTHFDTVFSPSHPVRIVQGVQCLSISFDRIVYQFYCSDMWGVNIINQKRHQMKLLLFFLSITAHVGQYMSKAAEHS